MVPNFNLNYLSSMFLDIARFETTTTIYGSLINSITVEWGESRKTHLKVDFSSKYYNTTSAPLIIISLSPNY